MFHAIILGRNDVILHKTSHDTLTEAATTVRPIAHAMIEDMHGTGIQSTGIVSDSGNVGAVYSINEALGFGKNVMVGAVKDAMRKAAGVVLA